MQRSPVASKGAAAFTGIRNDVFPNKMVNSSHESGDIWRATFKTP
jgi:hypothetical protein